MSLINDVLRDLEERRGGLLPGQEAVLSGLHPSEAGGTPAWRWRRALVLVTVGLSLALAATRAWYGADRIPAGADPAPGPSPAAERGSPVAPFASSPAAAASDPSLELAAGLLEEAARDLVRATLESPPGQRPPAPGRLEGLTPEALKIDPETEGGEDGVALAGALPWRDLEPVRSMAPERRVVTPPATAGRQGGDPEPARVTAVPASAPGPAALPASTGEGTAPVVRRRSGSGDSGERLRQAALAWRQGRGEEAQRLLRELLRKEPDQARARLLLAQVLTATGRDREADRLLREGAVRDPGNPLLAMAWARRLAGRGELQAALEVLRRSQGEAAADARYQAFIAALSQRAGLHQEAIDAWRRALLRRPDEGAWHLGLAISLQALGRREEAVRAYRRAAGNRGLSASLREFARGRLARLEQRTEG